MVNVSKPKYLCTELCPAAQKDCAAIRWNFECAAVSFLNSVLAYLARQAPQRRLRAIKGCDDIPTLAC
jgi:hypothetical protein